VVFELLGDEAQNNSPTGEQMKIAYALFPSLIAVMACQQDDSSTNATAEAAAATSAVHWYPGIYVKDGDSIPEMKATVGTRFVARGVQMRLNWNQFQTGPTTFDFSKVDQWVDQAKAAGWKLQLLVSAKGFKGTASPAYLKTDPRFEGGVVEIDPLHSGSGDNIKLWLPAVRDEYVHAIERLATRYKDEPTLAGISFAELVFGKPKVVTVTREQLEGYAENQKLVLLAAKRAAPGIPMMQFINGPHFMNDNFRDVTPAGVTSWFVENGIGQGGPDIYPQSMFLMKNGAYAAYGVPGATPAPTGELVGEVPIALTFNPENNAAIDHGVRPLAQQNVRELIDFAREKAHANFLFVTLNNSVEWFRPRDSFFAFASSAQNPSRTSIDGGCAAAVPGAMQRSLRLGLGFERMVAGRAADSSTFAHHGTLRGDTKPGRVASVDGEHGRALAVDLAKRQYVEMGDSDALDVDTFTLAAWVRVRPAGADTRFEVLEKAGAYWLNVRADDLRVRAGGFFGGCATDGSWKFVDSVRALTPDTWYHLAATYDGGKLSIYIDGVLDAQIDAAGRTCANTMPLAVGAKVDPDGGLVEALFNGTIDDVRVYDRALAVGDIAALMEFALD
jgi:Concanavalin A-like lectin/glucanases superfamily